MERRLKPGRYSPIGSPEEISLRRLEAASYIRQKFEEMNDIYRKEHDAMRKKIFRLRESGALDDLV